MPPERARLEPVPQNACGPLRSAVNSLGRDVQNMGGPSHDTKTKVGVDTYIANHMASSCARLCVDGCTLDQRNSVTTSGTTSRERATLSALVFTTIATDGLDRSSSPEPSDVMLGTGGEFLRKVIQSRFTFVSTPEVSERLAGRANVTNEEFSEAAESFQTPIAEDVYDEMDRFTNGNVRASLAIISYFITVFPVFRSTDADDVAIAESMRERGFHPGNPWEITRHDIGTVAGLVDDDGIIELPESASMSTFFRITDDPESMRIFRRVNGEVIDITDGNLPILATSTAVEVSSKKRLLYDI